MLAAFVAAAHASDAPLQLPLVTGAAIGVSIVIAMTEKHAKFQVGQLVEHRLFNYRGIVYDADPVFQGTEEWYQAMARTRPPKDQPWYHVLVHNGVHSTYVAERNLQSDPSGDPIVHPATDQFFEAFADGRYRPRRTMN